MVAPSVSVKVLAHRAAPLGHVSKPVNVEPKESIFREIAQVNMYVNCIVSTCLLEVHKPRHSISCLGHHVTYSFHFNER